MATGLDHGLDALRYAFGGGSAAPSNSNSGTYVTSTTTGSSNALTLGNLKSAYDALSSATTVANPNFIVTNGTNSTIQYGPGTSVNQNPFQGVSVFDDEGMPHPVKPLRTEPLSFQEIIDEEVEKLNAIS